MRTCLRCRTDKNVSKFIPEEVITSSTTCATLVGSSWKSERITLLGVIRSFIAFRRWTLI